MLIYPAIDIIDKQAVRLLRGDYEKKTVYSSSPLSVAKEFYSKGARQIHLVDLDGAKSGNTDNFEVIREISENTDMFIEIGGGIRTLERIEKYLEVGVKRVILGTAALEDRAFLKEALRKFGDAVSVGVDAKDSRVATHGWLNVTETDSFEFCKELFSIGVSHVIYTDISRDGAESGTNLEAYRRLSEIKGLKITASGGITFEEEIKTLSEMGLDSAILGKALYTGKLDLERAIALAR